MKKESKELLLKDISARPSYGVVCKTPQGDGHLNEISLGIFGHELGVNIKAIERAYFKLEECKPYLRPMDSMTEEEKEEYNIIVDALFDTGISYLNDWLNSHHFDYRGLIPKGLAIEAPEGMYDTK